MLKPKINLNDLEHNLKILLKIEKNISFILYINIFSVNFFLSNLL